METLNNIKPLLITKEQVSELTFNDTDELQSEAEKAARIEKLQKAMFLGNSPDHIKVFIVFKSKQGFFRVETTVWAVGDTNIQLKSNTFIPIKAIVDVVF